MLKLFFVSSLTVNRLTFPEWRKVRESDDRTLREGALSV